MSIPSVWVNCELAGDGRLTRQQPADNFMDMAILIPACPNSPSLIYLSREMLYKVIDSSQEHDHCIRVHEH